MQGRHDMKNNLWIPLLSIVSTIALGSVMRRVELTSFNAGQMSPLMNARSDFAKTRSGARTLQNMLVRAQGPVQRRPGTKYIATVKDSNDPVRLIPFEYSTTDAYIIELGDLYARFYRNGAQILDPNNDPYEIVTPWDANDVFELQFAQDAEMMRIVHPDYQPYKLTRTGHAAWTCGPIMFETGPFWNENKDVTSTITPNGTGQSVGYDAYITGADSWRRVQGVQWKSQSFTASAGYDAGGVRLMMWRKGTPGTVTVSLKAASGHAPTGAALASGTFDGDTLPTYPNQTWTKVTFDSPYTLVDSTEYCLEVKATSGDAYNNAQWMADSTTPSYPNGAYAYSDDSGSSWTVDTSYDCMFDVLEDGETEPGRYIQLTASADIFDANHVGALWQLRHLVDSVSMSGNWSQTLASDANSQSITVYEDQEWSFYTTGTWMGTVTIQRSGDSGTTWQDVGQPFTTRFGPNAQMSGAETEDDALYRVHWENTHIDVYGGPYDGRSDKYVISYHLTALSFWKPGIVEITAVVDANDANATVIETLGGTAATYKWSEGAWSDYRGWPRTVEHHEQRCLYGGSSSYPQTIWASIIAEEDADYDDFDAGQIVVGSDAWTYTLPGMNPIQWLKSTEYLMVGTTSGVVRVGSSDKPINPTWPAMARVQAQNGCDYLQPVHAVDAILYVERGGQKIRELTYSYASDRYVAPDMTILSEDITGDGITQIAVQNRSDPILWLIREDGVLLSFTYQRKNDIYAWSQHTTGE